MPHFLGVNLLAVGLAAVVTMIIGGLWYSPLLFARPWMVAMGFDPNDKGKIAEMQKGACKLYALAFVASLVAAFVLAKLFVRTEVADLPRAMMYSVAVWGGFVATVQFTAVLFGNRP